MRDCRLARCASVLLLLLLLTPPVSSMAQETPTEATPPQADVSVQAALHDILSSQAQPLPEIIAGLGKGPIEWLQAFYAGRNNAPLWMSTTAPSAAISWMLDRSPQALPTAVGPLLEPAAVRRHQSDPTAMATLELLLSTIYAVSAVDANDPLATQDGGRALFLLAAAADRQKVLRDTLPIDPGFWRLREAIVLYRGFAAVGGWPGVPDGPKLDVGRSGPRVDALRRRLVATGDLAEAVQEGGAFDDALRQAVQRFQARHGLQTDGVVGAKTLAALNVPVNRRLGVMAANLIRLQRQHRNWGGRYIVVNVPAAAYRLVVDGQMVFERPAVVGRPSWQTPMLDGVIDRLEFHPYWRIPMSIADREVWPKQDADPGYFAARGIHVIGDQLVQDPGPSNPLGVVKFVFDNPHSVYLHDTTAPELFGRPYRFSSHGCVRVSDAEDLARRLLAPDPQWPPEKVDRALQHGGHQAVFLAVPMPLHIVYDTAWVAEDGTIQFRDDIYHRDVIPAAGALSDGFGRVAYASEGGARTGGCGAG